MSASHPTVVILAAGQGRRFLEQGERLHKALVPVAGKPVLNYILESFPHNPVVIAVGHLASQIKQYWEILSPPNSVRFVDVPNYNAEGSGPGASLAACRHFVQGPFYTVACDTIIGGPAPPIDSNWIGVAPIDNPARFCTVALDGHSRVLSLDDKAGNSPNRLAYIGLAAIEDAELFWNALEHSTAMIDNERQVSSGLLALIPGGLEARQFHWLDTGTPESLAQTRIQMGERGGDFSKPDEQTYLLDRMVIKWVSDGRSVVKKLRRAKLLEGLVPKIQNNNSNFFSYEWVSGEPLYRCTDRLDITSFLNWLKTNLWSRAVPSDQDSSGFRRACDGFYRLKTLKRIRMLHERKKDDAVSENWTRLLRRVDAALDAMQWGIFSAKAVPCIFHGDLNFGNVLVAQSFKPPYCLIDWREDFSGIDYGDLYYDLGKLYAGLCVDFEAIRQSGCPRIEILKDGSTRFDGNVSSTLIKFQGVLRDWCACEKIDFDHVRRVAALSFLNMAPLHVSPLDGYFVAVGLHYLEPHAQMNCGYSPSSPQTLVTR